MRITKFGHSCLLVEENGLKVFVDPGSWNKLPEGLNKVDVLLITHEHQDHLNLDSIKQLLNSNQNLQIFTNRGVAKVLSEQNIKYSLLEHGQSSQVNGVLIEGFGTDHAPIYPSVPPVANTGYLIAGKLFHPGDALTTPDKQIEMLALPICAPWMKLADAIDYVLKVKPGVVFPIHDGMLKITTPFYSLAEKVLTESGVKFIVLEGNHPIDF